jgi:hypothetical protein
MVSKELLIAQTERAFSLVEHPGDWNLRRSSMGDEPYLVEEEFTGKSNWRELDSTFLDQAPSGLGSALCFLSDPAFRYYLPAYLIADINRELGRVEPVFHLVRGFDDKSREKRINPKMYGERKWSDESTHRFSMFTQEEAKAIVAYLEWKRIASPYDRDAIDQALRNYWNERAGSQQPDV